MVLEFYFDNVSQVCRAVYLFLKGTGVDFEPKEVELLKGQQHEADFVKKSPFHKIPIIDDDGFLLAESVAIMRYIAVKYNVAEHWFPRTDVQKAAKIDEFLNWQHLNIRQWCLEIFVNTFRSRVGIGERFSKKPLDEQLVGKAKEELTKSLNHIATCYLKDDPFICGDEISAADLIGVSELIHLGAVNESELFESNPTIKAWIKRVGDRMHPHYDEANAKLDFVKKMFNDAKP